MHRVRLSAFGFRLSVPGCAPSGRRCRESKGLSCLAALLAAAACSESVSTLTVSAPAQVNLRKGASATVTVAGRVGDMAIMTGEQISLSTDLGTLQDANAPGGAEVEAQSSVNLTVSAGKVVATLKPDSENQPGVSHLTARYIDVYQREVIATASVQWVAPKVANLVFTCITYTIGAFVQSGEEIAIKCKAAGYDDDNHWVSAAKVKFLTEAGGFALIDGPANPEEKGQVFYYLPRFGNKNPKDVPPLGDAATGEPRYSDPMTHTTRNPRDGLASLVAYVPGDPIPGYTGEPFVDENDDNVWNEGEEYADLNGNRQYDDDQTAVQWRQVKMLWTSELCAPNENRACVDGTRIEQSFTDPSHPAVTELAIGQSLRWRAVLLDYNYNIPSANIVDDSISVSSTADGVEFTEGSVDPLVRGVGIDMEANTFKLRNPTKAASYERGALHYFTVFNGNTADPEADPPAVGLGLTLTVKHNYALDESGTSGSELEETVAFSTSVAVSRR